ncbi:MAG: hypothetical protein EB100_03430, partial [Crocinitomicaceae bacterium]|nr:hypothetical protein [Crocinitomicaceae bacterium]
MFRKNSHINLLSKILFFLTTVFLISNFTTAQSCVAKIEFETVNNTLSGCAPFNVIFIDKNSSSRQWNFSDSTFTPAELVSGGYTAKNLYDASYT